ncbi:MAG TPA: hypothetical protein VF945_13160 [Polyangia bacterium]
MGVALVLCACGDDGPQSLADLAAIGEDLAVPAGRDLAPLDMTTPVDWSFNFGDGAGLCESPADASNGVAGTCAQSFFAKLADCWVPSGVMCTYDKPANHWDQFCWDDGAALQTFRCNSPAYAPGIVCYVRGTFLCMKHEIPCDYTGTPRTTEKWTAYDGTVLIHDTATGEVTCPDGSHVTIGPNYGGCVELSQLIAGSSGSCQTAGMGDAPYCPPFQQTPLGPY